MKAKIKDEYKSNYEFVGVDGSTLNEGVETDGEEFEMKDYDPNDPDDPNRSRQSRIILTTPTEIMMTTETAEH